MDKDNEVIDTQAREYVPPKSVIVLEISEYISASTAEDD